MSDKDWKVAERRMARFFGSVRNSLSGGSSKLTRSDSIHKKLFVECKLTKESAVWSLWERTKIKAQQENKTPVLCIQKKNRKGFLVIAHTTDFDEVAQIRMETFEAEEKSPQEGGLIDEADGWDVIG